MATRTKRSSEPFCRELKLLTVRAAYTPDVDHLALVLGIEDGPEVLRRNRQIVNTGALQTLYLVR